MLFWHDLFSVIIVVWIDADAWYHEWHCYGYEYCHIQFMLFWHELYAVIFFLMLIDTRWWCSKWRILPSYNSCHFNVNCIVMVTLIDTSAWYYELHLHCCEYYQIQLMLFWHELCNELLKLPSYNSSLFNTNCMVWYQSVLCFFVICLCCHKLCL